MLCACSGIHGICRHGAPQNAYMDRTATIYPWSAVFTTILYFFLTVYENLIRPLTPETPFLTQ